MQCLKILFIFFSVTGFEIVFNPTKPVIDSTASGNFTISCEVNGVLVSSSDAIVDITLISGGMNIAQLYYHKITTLTTFIHSDYTNRGASVTYVHDVNSPGSSKLTVSIPVARLTCADGKEYTCEMNYVTYPNGESGGSVSDKASNSRNLTLTGMKYLIEKLLSINFYLLLHIL